MPVPLFSVATYMDETQINIAVNLLPVQVFLNIPVEVLHDEIFYVQERDEVYSYMAKLLTGESFRAAYCKLNPNSKYVLVTKTGMMSRISEPKDYVLVENLIPSKPCDNRKPQMTPVVNITDDDGDKIHNKKKSLLCCKNIDFSKLFGFYTGGVSPV